MGGGYSPSSPPHHSDAPESTYIHNCTFTFQRKKNRKFLSCLLMAFQNTVHHQLSEPSIIGNGNHSINKQSLVQVATHMPTYLCKHLYKGLLGLLHEPTSAVSSSVLVSATRFHSKISYALFKIDNRVDPISTSTRAIV